MAYHPNKIVIQNDSNITFYIGTYQGPLSKLFHWVPRIITNTTYVKVESSGTPKNLMRKPGTTWWPVYQELLDIKVIPPGETTWESDHRCIKKAWKALPKQLGKLNLSSRR